MECTNTFNFLQLILLINFLLNQKEYDASELIKSYNGPHTVILIDQGAEDNFLKDKQLNPDILVNLAPAIGDL